MHSTRGKVVLFMPRLLPPNFPGLDRYQPPLSLLALGRPLQNAGYEVRLIDALWDHDFREEIAFLAKDAVCLGISCLTGHSVRQGLEAAELAKKVNPSLPVVWGGWHPSFVAEQAASDPRIDVVVRGQGEITFIELLNALKEGRQLKGLGGITFRDGEEIVHNPDRPPQDINLFPPLAWELVDVSHYIRPLPGSVRLAKTILSRGCPYYCDFCLDSRRPWFGLNLRRAQEELEFWVLRHGANDVRFYDGNFFLGRQRIIDFTEMILRSHLAGRFKWVATGVAKRLVQFDGSTLELLRRSGCRQIAIGAESGSPELLATITNKTTVELTTEAVRLLTRHGINQYLFFMVGFPEEPERALEDTLALICRLKTINPLVEVSINFCIPLPGSEMFRIAVEKGLFHEPREFAEWANFDFMKPNLPGISDAYSKKVRRFLSYVELAYPIQDTHLGGFAYHRFLRHIYSAVRQMATLRLKKQNFDFPIELKLRDLYARITTRAE